MEQIDTDLAKHYEELNILQLCSSCCGEPIDFRGLCTSCLEHAEPITLKNWMYDQEEQSYLDQQDKS